MLWRLRKCLERLLFLYCPCYLRDTFLVVLIILETFEICLGEDTYECAYEENITKRNVLFGIKMYTDI